MKITNAPQLPIRRRYVESMTPSEMAIEIRQLRDENARLQSNLASRDDFLGSIGQWEAYTATLPPGAGDSPHLAKIERLRAALKKCGDEARAAFRGDLDESETLSDINNFVIKTLGDEQRSQPNEGLVKFDSGSQKLLCEA